VTTAIERYLRSTRVVRLEGWLIMFITSCTVGMIPIIRITFREAAQIIILVSISHRWLNESLKLRMGFREPSHQCLPSVHPWPAGACCIGGAVWERVEVIFRYLHLRIRVERFSDCLRLIKIVRSITLLFNIVYLLCLIFLETRGGGIHLIKLILDTNVAAVVIIIGGIRRHHPKSIVRRVHGSGWIH